MMSKCIVLVLAVVSGCFSTPEDYSQHKSSLPSPVRYFKLPEVNSTEAYLKEEEAKSDHEPRFGVQLGYGNDIQGYSGGNHIGYTPLKIDLGGLVLGTVIGLGAVLLAPKIFHIFSPSHHPGPYARSEGIDMFSSIGKTIARLDERLQEQDIDTMSCLQKVACNVVRSVGSAKDMINSNNPILNFVIDGSKLKTALDRGMRGENCAEAFPHCNFSSNNILK